MKKKPVQKKVLGGILLNKMTDGKIMAPIGILPQLAYGRSRDKNKAAKTAAKSPKKMQAGGMARGDGACSRGHTKGKMV